MALTNTQAGMLRCGAAAVLFGATTPVASRIAEDTTAPVLAGLLYVGAALAALPFARSSSTRAALVRPDLGRLATAVVAGGLLGPLLLVAGLSRVPASTASLLLNLELVFTVLIAAWFFGEHLGRRVVVGTVVVLAAGATAGWSDTPDLRWGALLITGACICWALDNCVTAGLATMTPEQITLAKGAVAGTTNLLLGLAVGGALPGWRDIVLALLAGALGYGLSITLWVAGARELGAARGQLVFSMAPFVGVVLAWTAFDGDVRGAELVALLLALTGVATVVRSSHLHEHAHRPQRHSHEHAHDDGHHDHLHEAPVPERHVHPHAHLPLVHAHPHVPDLHHRHEH